MSEITRKFKRPKIRTRNYSTQKTEQIPLADYKGWRVTKHVSRFQPMGKLQWNPRTRQFEDDRSTMTYKQEIIYMAYEDGGEIEAISSNTLKELKAKIDHKIQKRNKAIGRSRHA